MRFKWLFVMVPASLALAAYEYRPVPAKASPPVYGVNWHASKVDGADDERVLRLLRQRNLKMVRIGVALAADTDGTAAPRLRRLLDTARRVHPKLRFLVMLQTGFAWGDRTDRGAYPTGDAIALYRQGFERTRGFVMKFADEPIDWELGNELNLLVKDAGNQPIFGKGWNREEFDTPLMHDWAHVLKGMSDAIVRVKRPDGSHPRRVLNTTSTNFGFLDFMRDHGVGFEVIDYHSYDRMGTVLASYWGGARPSFNLMRKLDSYGAAIIFGEVNAGEIYDPAYGNRDGDALTEAGYRSLSSTLIYLNGQTHAPVEAVLAYELFDEPEKPRPENRFGVMRDSANPKASMLILSAMAGGRLTDAEKRRVEDINPRLLKQ